MRTSAFLIAIAGVAVAASPAIAQRRVFSPAPSSPAVSPFALPTNSDLGRTLGGRELPIGTTQFTARQMTVVDSIPVARQTCPMPVVSPRIAPMPTVVADSSRSEAMPVVRPPCVNPLRR